MPSKMPVLSGEYELTFAETTNEQEVMPEGVPEIVIAGYKVTFDRKVALVPTEFLKIDQILE